MDPKALIVEDEAVLLETLAYNLTRQGYAVSQAGTGPQALEVARAEQPDLVVLDIMLPGMDGFEVCRILRQETSLPILMLTARAEEIDRVLGLELGADDYLTKPFSMRELKARVRALLRRVEMMQTTDLPADQVVTSAGLYLDPTSYETRLDDQAIDLTAKEFSLLYLLVRHPGRVFSRAYLLDAVWGQHYVAGDRSVDNAVLRLRKKLGVLGEAIETVWGVGYRLAPLPEKRQ
mgnify:CR=1 FL=1